MTDDLISVKEQNDNWTRDKTARDQQLRRLNEKVERMSYLQTILERLLDDDPFDHAKDMCPNPLNCDGCAWMADLKSALERATQ